MCDQISDAILDEFLKQDPKSRVACEAFVTTGIVLVGGEVTTEAYVDIPSVVRNVIREIGYDNAEYGFDYKTCGVLTSIQQQSPDIAMGVDKGGAGDQGMMFGYATNETPELMPMPIVMAHRLLRRLAEIRKRGELPYLRPDAKSQVTLEYDDGVPVRVDTVVLSAQHDGDVAYNTIAKDLKKHVIEYVIPKNLRDSDVKIYINPTGRFEIGGPHGDTGLTGRKIIVDTYGGLGRHGGGAFSGKDPSKVDRSAAYFARYVAKNIIASGIAKRCELQVSYAIGIAEPVSIMVDTFGTSTVANEKITKVIRNMFDFTPRGIIKTLNLLRPIYLKTAAYGHFGRNEDGFTWEKTDKAEELKKKLEKK
ncbi:MAG: methionine adenosyltransferase [Omnitrophica bacterium RIFCSPLOWO2_12_FULL_44_17]|uniref:S-adenosylmethionine synthase n=1 Tax=Candidatus Danuiimicrobium aquiferis TaxID=1801832 RepID=A0A1G1L244_9BACT|nr:MAG: methionine adenosyltransferase [Omnitrophica bacterium RIFCSPHIGHO2_02_FULL_45_28]OGW91303.1 MAG: methionine adenosyltransferase [Omnitrophica bacterium RIFCSPHIGHO2_12_FULL_44_12]OGW99211.1 MAG: methionine adenosyltransferase [Omnitrophica bacterium RIFCSPLOWO2_12_FULL_44_17]OGX04435.1 MAG: methionine adenosyltransferase [Omnitrophica bacterium RIFCSPLOWO2_02_FULL_44_11]